MPDSHPDKQPGPPKQTPAARRRELARQALGMAQSGIDYGTIAASLRVSKSTARRLVRLALKHCQRESRLLGNALVALEEERLDSVLRRCTAVANDPDARPATKMRALGVMLKIHDRRVRLLGLAAAPRVAVVPPERPCLARPRVDDAERAATILKFLSKATADTKEAS
jgi:hypothetical protein